MTRLRGLVLLSVVVLATAVSSLAGVFVSVAIGPPALPVYSQPLCPGPGYIWTPGYWAWGPAGYFWVPGTWVLPPQVGFLWTPGFWAFSAGFYNWHSGFWGPRVGFYGGINYGFGYTGVGYWGGYWRGNNFYYNRTVNNVNITNIHNVYNQTVLNNVNVNHVGYNGGPNGVQARPMPRELDAERGQHIGPTSAQLEHEQAARSDRAQFASVNHGRPATAATPRPGALNSREAAGANQPAMIHPAANTNASNNIRQVPRPPQDFRAQNSQPARSPANVPRPPQKNYAPQASANVPRPPVNNQHAGGYGGVPRPGNYAQPVTSQARSVPRPPAIQQASRPQPARYANNAPRQSAPQYRAVSRPPSQRQATQPHQAAAQRPPGGGHQQGRPR